MKIAIIGAGAMGCLYGAKLSTVPGIEIYLLDVWKEHVDAINANGILMEEQGDFITYRNVKASTVAEDAGTCDLAVIFCKIHPHKFRRTE